MSQKKSRGSKTDAYSLMGLGFEFTGILLIPAGIGYLVDRFVLETGPGFFFLTFFLIGFAYGIYYLVRTGLGALQNSTENETIHHSHRSIEERSRDVHAGMDEIGRRIADLEKRSPKKKE